MVYLFLVSAYASLAVAEEFELVRFYHLRD